MTHERNVSFKCKQVTSNAGSSGPFKTSLSLIGCHYPVGVGTYLFIVKQCLLCNLQTLFYTGGGVCSPGYVLKTYYFSFCASKFHI